jgi:catechol 2,3-dioxygenase-like lactoylglutathione lyase family enzyme
MKISNLIPMLPVADIARGIAFYEKLGFTVEDHNDAWRWAMLANGGCRLMLDQSINTHPTAPRNTVIYLYPDDITAFHRQARANGLPLPDLDETFYGMTEFRLDDPDGNRLWVGQEREPAARGA